MASITLSRPTQAALYTTPKKRNIKAFETLFPHWRTAVSIVMILAGLSVPLLMMVGTLPASFLLAFVGFVLAATGSVLTLILCADL